jgi:hypothetical protein
MEIPPSFVSAYYVDRDSGKADGVVDAAIIRFDKKVDIAGLSLLFDWGSSLQKSTVQSSAVAYLSADSTLISVDLKAAFSGRPAVKTSGDMFVTSQWKKFTGKTDNFKVQDSAGPVIASASYFMSAEIGNACDTLIVSFSEPSSVAPNDNATPFKFLSKWDGAGYILTLSRLPQLAGDTLMGFCVTSTPAGVMPRSGDSIWINPTAGVADKLGAVQAIEINRRVVFKVSQPNSDLIVKAVKNPFTPGTTIPGSSVTGTAITISTVNPKAKLPSLTAHVMIFDLLGNCVYEDNAVKLGSGKFPDPCYYFEWDGRNLHHRAVGSGTYNIMVSYTVEGEPIQKKMIRIGVKR